MSTEPESPPPANESPASSKKLGQVITFYSYKGGVGRSMSVANVATLLAQRKKRVLVIDFDFEAPGLHRYFTSATQRALQGEQSGMIEFLHRLQAELENPERQPVQLEEIPDGAPRALIAQQKKAAQARRTRAIVAKTLAAEAYVQTAAVKNPNGNEPATVDLMTAGKFDDEYPSRVRSFNWVTFFTAHPFAFRALAEELSQHYHYVLIDSRTGITDIGSVCTVLLPEKLVLVFAPNEQSLNGAVEIGRQAVAARKKSPDMRPLPLFPLMSRVENAEEDLQRDWIRVAKTRFEQLFQEVYGLDKCELTTYFDAVRIPHKSKYAYGEQIAAEHQRTTEDGTLAAAYQQLVEAIERNNVVEAQSHLLARQIRPNEAQAVAAVAEERARDAEAKAAAVVAEKAQVEEKLKVALTEKEPPQRWRFAQWASVVLLPVVAAGATWLLKTPASVVPPPSLVECIDTNLADLPAEERKKLVEELQNAEPPPLGGAVYRTSQGPLHTSYLETCRNHSVAASGFTARFRVLRAGLRVPGVGVSLEEGNSNCTTNSAGECSLRIAGLPMSHTVVIARPPESPTKLPLGIISDGEPIIVDLPRSDPPTASSSGASSAPGALILDERGVYMARAVVNTIETLDPNVDYFIYTLRKRGPQEVFSNSILTGVVTRYVTTKGKYASELQPFLALDSARKREATKSKEFAELLYKVATDPAMVGISAAILMDQYWRPAIERGGELGLKTPLSAALLYDTALASVTGLENTIQATTKQLGGTPLTGVDEKKWMTAFLQTRTLRKESKPIFLELVGAGNWELRDPVRVRNQTVPTPTFGSGSSLP